MAAALEAGAADVSDEGDVFEVYTDPAELSDGERGARRGGHRDRRRPKSEGAEDLRQARGRRRAQGHQAGRGARRPGRRAARERQLRHPRRDPAAGRAAGPHCAGAGAGHPGIALRPTGALPRRPLVRRAYSRRHRATAWLHTRRRSREQRTGFGLVRGSGDDVHLRVLGDHCGRVGPRRATSACASIFSGIERVIREHQPTHFAIEDVFYSKNPRSALVLGEARGVAILAARHARKSPCSSILRAR